MATMGERDIDAMREAADAIRVADAWLAGWLAGAVERRDPVTGLANRIAFFLLADRLLRSPSRSGMAVALVDVNHFKAVNDTFGHGTGDQVLRHVGGALQDRAGADGLIGRLAGDEFVAVTPRPAGTSLAAVAAHLGRAIPTPVQVAGGRLVVALSVGITPAGPNVPDVPLAELLGRADAAMYRAKHTAAGAAVYDPVVDDHTVAIAGTRPPVRTRDLHQAGHLVTAAEPH